MNEPPRANELLQQARLERGWTQDDLAGELGVTGQAVGSWERGTRFPSPRSRRRLCAIFSKTPQQLGLEPEALSSQLSQALKGDSPEQNIAQLEPESGPSQLSQEPSLPIAALSNQTHAVLSEVDAILDQDAVPPPARSGVSPGVQSSRRESSPDAQACALPLDYRHLGTLALPYCSPGAGITGTT